MLLRCFLCSLSSSKPSKGAQLSLLVTALRGSSWKPFWPSGACTMAAFTNTSRSVSLPSLELSRIVERPHHLKERWTELLLFAKKRKTSFCYIVCLSLLQTPSDLVMHGRDIRGGCLPISRSAMGVFLLVVHISVFFWKLEFAPSGACFLNRHVAVVP